MNSTSKPGDPVSELVRKLIFHVRGELHTALILADFVSDSRDKLAAEYGETIGRSLREIVSAIGNFESEYYELHDAKNVSFEKSKPIAVKAAAHSTPLRTKPKRDAAGGRILLVEDNLVNQTLVKRILERIGFLVEATGTGEEAMALAEKNSFDLVLMDISLPGIDGFEACRKLKELRTTREVPVVALSAHSQPAERAKAQQCGMAEFLSKPVDPKALSEAINRLLLD